MATMTTDSAYRTPPVEIHDLIEQLCERLSLDSAYVSRLEIEPTHLTVHVFRGEHGICDGPKYTNKGRPGQISTAAIERLEFDIRA